MKQKNLARFHTCSVEIHLYLEFEFAIKTTFLQSFSFDNYSPYDHAPLNPQLFVRKSKQRSSIIDCLDN